MTQKITVSLPKQVNGFKTLLVLNFTPSSFYTTEGIIVTHTQTGSEFTETNQVAGRKTQQINRYLINTVNCNWNFYHYFTANNHVEQKRIQEDYKYQHILWSNVIRLNR